jgi:dTDP-4-amino-4,6-dideoxy-D-glucose transaminase
MEFRLRANISSIRDRREVTDLAIFGGEPAFSRSMYVSRPSVPSLDMFMVRVAEAWERQWFTNDGPLAQELERELAAQLDVSHCVLAGNGTAAMSILFKALDLDGEVLIPSYTFISTAHALSMAGIKPVFADVEPDSWNIDLAHCQRLLTRGTSAIIATHLFGATCDVGALERFCKDHGLKLIFDSAHAFGCSVDGRPVGSFGDAEVFSFHATKAFHTFEGGAVTTNDARTASRLRKLRNFGFDENGHVAMVGTNAKMSEIHAAMGLANLECIAATLKRSQDCHTAYQQALAGVEGISVYRPDLRGRSNYHYVVADVDSKRFGLTRDQLLRVLQAENIVARRYFYPDRSRDFPYTDRLNDRLIQFPGGADVKVTDVEKICSLMAFIGNSSRDISAMLAASVD